MNNLCSS